MFCPESEKLESLYRQRYERTRMVETGTMPIVLDTKVQPLSHALMVRQYRAKLAQAASAILIHQKNCRHCSSQEHQLESLAS